MANYSKSKIPATNVTITDVKDTLQSSSTILSALSLNSNINQYSIFKPSLNDSASQSVHRYGQSHNELNGVHGAGEDSSGWSKPYVLFPLVPTFNPVQQTNVALSQIIQPWTKMAPYPYRLGDFRQYVHASQYYTCGTDYRQVAPYKKNSISVIYTTGALTPYVDLYIQHADELTNGDAGYIGFDSMYYNKQSVRYGDIGLLIFVMGGKANIGSSLTNRPSPIAFLWDAGTVGSTSCWVGSEPLHFVGGVANIVNSTAYTSMSTTSNWDQTKLYVGEPCIVGYCFYRKILQSTTTSEIGKYILMSAYCPAGEQPYLLTSANGTAQRIGKCILSSISGSCRALYNSTDNTLTLYLNPYSMTFSTDTYTVCGEPSISIAPTGSGYSITMTNSTAGKGIVGSTSYTYNKSTSDFNATSYLPKCVIYNARNHIGKSISVRAQFSYNRCEYNSSTQQMVETVKVVNGDCTIPYFQLSQTDASYTMTWSNY